MQDGSGALSFTGKVTPGEEKNQKENGFPGEKMSSQQMAWPASRDYKPLWESFLYG